MKLQRALISLATITILTAIVLIGLHFGQIIQNMGGVIPSILFHFPPAPMNHQEFLSVISIFALSHFLIFTIVALFSGPNTCSNIRRSVIDLYALVTGFCLTSFGIFLLTDLPFDPEFFASGFVVTAFILIFIHTLITIAFRKSEPSLIWKTPFLLLLQAITNLRSAAGLLIIIAVFVPVITAAVYTNNPNFANAVTRLRVSLNQGAQGSWKFTDLIEGHRFLQPMLARFSSKGDIYVLERAGRVYRLAAPLFDSKDLVLDFSEKVGLADKENGAQGFDFHPMFGDNNELIYVYYTDYSDPNHQVNKLSQFDLSQDPRSSLDNEYILISQNRSNDGFHNGGTVEFGPDGFLYLSLGEMSSAVDHQTINHNLRGGILRIDPLMQGGELSHPPTKQPFDGYTQGYYVPYDNPFTDIPEALGEFWAIGLRNPFRVSFDPASKLLWAGEVGSAVWEEINIIEKGGNYQFPYIEGQSAQENKSVPQNIIGNEKEPKYFYKHTAFDRAVIGGIVYRGNRHEELYGKYIFGDNYSGKIWGFDANQTTNISPVLLTQVNQLAQRGITSIQQAPDGHIIITTLGESDRATGRLLRIVSAEEWVNQNLTDDVTVVAPTAISKTRAKSLFGENCARCHGDEGKGDGPDADQFDVAISDFTDVSFHGSRSNEELREIIIKGGDAIGKSFWMPPWEGILTEAEVDGLISYIRELNPEHVPIPEGHSEAYHRNN